MPALTTQSFIDHSGEQTSFSLWTPDLDAGNIDTYTNTNLTFELGDMLAAVNALTLCNRTVTTVGALRDVSAATIPADPNAQRETKLLIKYIDTVTSKKYSLTIPGVDRTLVAQQGTDQVDFNNNAFVIAFVNSIENGYISELGNPIEVYDARLVGRNN